MKKHHKAALIIMPPENDWTQIQTIRKAHDKAFERWMPHINLVYPFADEDTYDNQGLKQKLTQALATFEPFEVKLCDFDMFVHSAKNCTMFINSELNRRKIVDVQSALVSVVPECNDLNTRSADNEFHPHLTLGQFRGESATNTKIRTLKTSWKPISWVMDRIYLIRRTDTTPFEIVDEILLGVKQQETTGTVTTKTVENLLQSLSISSNSIGNDPKDGTKELVTKITTWMKNMRQQQQNLPKSKQSLSKAITRMCCISSSVQWKTILQKLIEKQLIKRTGKGYELQRKNLQNLNSNDYESYNENLSIPKSSGYSYYSSYSKGDDSGQLSVPKAEKQEKMALDRAVLWLRSLSSSNLSLTTKSLESQLEQLCIFKIYISAESVVNSLEKLHLLSVADDYESISYLI